MSRSNTIIHVDRKRCIASGNCVLAAPEIFDQDDSDGTVVLVKDEAEGAEVEAAKQAAHNCPAGAIQVEDCTLAH